MMGGDLEGKNLGILDFGQINDREIQYFSKNGVLSLVMKAVLPKLAENHSLGKTLPKTSSQVTERWL